MLRERGKSMDKEAKNFFNMVVIFVLALVLFVGYKALTVYAPTKFKNPDMDNLKTALECLDYVEEVKYEYSRPSISMRIDIYIDSEILSEAQLHEVRVILEEKYSTEVMDKVGAQLGTNIDHANVNVICLKNKNPYNYRMFGERSMNDKEIYDWGEWGEY